MLPAWPSRNGSMSARRRPGGAVLLEVVLALGIFFMGAAVVAGSLNISITATQRIKLQAQAADLAVTKLSEIQMGLLSVADDGPNAYSEDENLPDWTWQVVTTPMDEQMVVVAGPVLKRVEIIIRNANMSYVYRLTHVLPSQDDGGGTTPAGGEGP